MSQTPRIGKLLAGLAVLLVAGCSSAAEPEPAALGPVETDLDVSVPIDQLSSEPLGDLVEMVERTMATPHRYETFLELPDGNDDIDPDKPIQSGAFDGTWLAVDTFFGPFQPEDESGPVMQAITGGGIGYFAMPGWRTLEPEIRNQMLAGNPLAPAVDSWVVMDLTQVQDRTGIDELSFTPNMADVADNLTEILTTVVDVQEGPASSIRGVATRAFAGTIPADPDDLFSLDDIAVSFHVDGQGYVRSATTDSSFGRSRIEIFDIGAAPTIELPESAIDITESSIELLAQQQRATAPAPVPAPTLVLPPTPVPPPTPMSIPTSTPTVQRQDSVLDLIAFQPELSIFFSLVVESGLDVALDDITERPRAVLAPTNDGLEQMGDDLDRIRNDETLLFEFVHGHVLVDSYTVAELELADQVSSILGDVLTVSNDGGRVVLGLGASVLVGDVNAANGVMHVIDRPVR